MVVTPDREGDGVLASRCQDPLIHRWVYGGKGRSEYKCSVMVRSMRINPWSVDVLSECQSPQ